MPADEYAFRDLERYTHTRRNGEWNERSEQFASVMLEPITFSIWILTELHELLINDYVSLCTQIVANLCGMEWLDTDSTSTQYDLHIILLRALFLLALNCLPSASPVILFALKSHWNALSSFSPGCSIICLSCSFFLRHPTGRCTFFTVCLFGWFATVQTTYFTCKTLYSSKPI